MNFGEEEALTVADATIFDKKGRHLTDVEAAILRGAWQGKTYKEIAETSHYGEGYLRRDVGLKLWRLLSEVLEEKVSKGDFREALKRRWRSSHSSGTVAGYEATSLTQPAEVPSSSTQEERKESLTNQDGMEIVTTRVLEQRNGWVSTIDLQELPRIPQSPPETQETFAVESLETSVNIPSTSLRSRPYHNLPRFHHTNLVGRQKQIDQLLTLLSFNHNTHLISIEGIIGVGKTALVLEVAHRCLEASCNAEATPKVPTFDAIIFTSAKQQHLIGIDILQRNRRERTLRDIFKTIFRTLESPDVIPAHFNDQLECLQRSLAYLRTLLIVDNLETIEDQEDVISFLHELPPTVKVVITTRIRTALGVPIHLECLPPDDSQHLIQHQIQEQRVQLNPEQFQALYQRTGGLPIAIIYTIGQMSVYGLPLNAVPAGLTTGDGAHYCFGELVQPLRGQPAYRLLMALALFTKSASIEAIAQVALAGANPIDGLAQLYKLRLVIQQDGWYNLNHSLTREYALAELKAHPEFEQEVRERWIDWYLRFSELYAGQDWKEWHVQYEHLEQEWENLRSVVEWCIKQDRYEDFRKFWQYLKGFTHLFGYWNERLIWMEWLISSAEQHQDQPTLAEALYDRGWTLILMGKPEQLSEADKMLAQAWNLRQYQDLIFQLDLAITAAVVHIRQQQLVEARNWLNESKNLLDRGQIEKAKHQRYLIRIDYYEAEIWFKTGDYEKANTLYNQALELSKIAEWKQVEVYALNWLADIAIEQRNLDEAERLLNLSQPIALDSMDKRSIAFHKCSWAKLEKLRGNTTESQRWATEAKDWFERLGMLSEVKQMKSWLEA
jgi:LuxR family glucitol operon transcriptional activator